MNSRKYYSYRDTNSDTINTRTNNQECPKTQEIPDWLWKMQIRTLNTRACDKERPKAQDIPNGLGTQQYFLLGKDREKNTGMKKV